MIGLCPYRKYRGAWQSWRGCDENMVGCTTKPAYWHAGNSYTGYLHNGRRSDLHNGFDPIIGRQAYQTARQQPIVAALSQRVDP